MSRIFRVAVVMGSLSDKPVMEKAVEILHKFKIETEFRVLSAHRTPHDMISYGKDAVSNNISVIIAGAGGAAHLPGMIAATTTIPVIGVPIKSSNSIDGWDSVLSILQMPNGVPVATVALNAAENAGILAAQIIGVFDEKVRNTLQSFKFELENKVTVQNNQLNHSFST